MKHLIRYDGYTSSQRLDDILDKISKYGIKSLNKDEKEFLDSHGSENQEFLHKELSKKEMETIFEDDNRYFKFELQDIEKFYGETHYKGVLYVPDLTWPNGKTLEGRLEGSIISYENGQVVPDFYSTVKDEEGYEYDAFEFCNGLEYELDSFLDYVVGELSGKTEN